MLHTVRGAGYVVRAASRTRLPVKLKLAVGSAALTFVILCLFAVVIGAVAEQRIVAAFDDELRATVAALEQRLTIEPGPDGRLIIDPRDEDELADFSAGNASVQVVNRRNELWWKEDGAPDLGAPVSGVASVKGLRVVSQELVVSAADPEAFSPIPGPVASTIGFVQYAKPEDSLALTVAKVRLFLAFGVMGGTMLAFLGGLLIARRGMRPIAGLTRAAREVARTRNPDITLPKPRANDEVPRPRLHAARTCSSELDRRARRDRGRARRASASSSPTPHTSCARR